jgi:hypothetical protein
MLRNSRFLSQYGLRCLEKHACFLCVMTPQPSHDAVVDASISARCCIFRLLFNRGGHPIELPPAPAFPLTLTL